MPRIDYDCVCIQFSTGSTYFDLDCLSFIPVVQEVGIRRSARCSTGRLERQGRKSDFQVSRQDVQGFTSHETILIHSPIVCLSASHPHYNTFIT